MLRKEILQKDLNCRNQILIINNIYILQRDHINLIK